MFKGAALIQQTSFHHVDHLAPFCELFSCPLLVLDPKQKELANHYYPFLQVCVISPLEMEPHILSSSYDFVFHSFFWDKSLLNDLRAIYVPHGNSDKGHHQTNYMEKFAQQDIALLYGNHMVDFLKKKRIFHKVNHFVRIGNVRYLFFLRHRKEFQKHIQKEIEPFLDLKKKTILYAPTWEDWENSSSFFVLCETLIEQLSEKFNLIIKLHPCLEIYSPAKTYAIMGKYEKNPHILFLSDFPLIYPLLEKIDIYLGDFSSIGYDVLTFNKPMFFFNVQHCPKKDFSRRLHHSGWEIPKEKWPQMVSFIEKKLLQDFYYKKKRKELYRYVFGSEKKMELIQQELIAFLCQGKK